MTMVEETQSRAGPQRERLWREAHRAAMARSLSVAFAAAATLGLISITAFRLAPQTDASGLLATVVAAYAVAAFVALGSSRLPLWSFSLLVACGTGLIALALYFGGDPRDDNEMFFVLVSLYAFYFFAAWQAALQMLAVGATYGVALAASPNAGSEAPVRWIVVMGVLVISGLIIRSLRRRVEGLIADLERSAQTDSLTGLLNLRGFRQAFAAELERARRNEESLSLLVADLDNFKGLNDQRGHPKGDQALQAVAALLLRRKNDTAARVGGDEFALLLPATGGAGACELAAQLQRELSGILSEADACTLSLGVAAYPEHGESPGDLLEAADQALYAAKRLGRNRCVRSEGAPIRVPAAKP